MKEEPIIYHTWRLTSCVRLLCSADGNSARNAGRFVRMVYTRPATTPMYMCACMYEIRANQKRILSREKKSQSKNEDLVKRKEEPIKIASCREGKEPINIIIYHTGERRRNEQNVLVPLAMQQDR